MQVGVAGWHHEGLEKWEGSCGAGMRGWTEVGVNGRGSVTPLNLEFGDWLMEFGEKDRGWAPYKSPSLPLEPGRPFEPLFVGLGLCTPESPLTLHEVQLMIIEKIIHSQLVASPPELEETISAKFSDSRQSMT